MGFSMKTNSVSIPSLAAAVLIYLIWSSSQEFLFHWSTPRTLSVVPVYSFRFLAVLFLHFTSCAPVLSKYLHFLEHAVLPSPNLYICYFLSLESM